MRRRRIAAGWAGPPERSQQRAFKQDYGQNSAFMRPDRFPAQAPALAAKGRHGFGPGKKSPAARQGRPGCSRAVLGLLRTAFPALQAIAPPRERRPFENALRPAAGASKRRVSTAAQRFRSPVAVFLVCQQSRPFKHKNARPRRAACSFCPAFPTESGLRVRAGRPLCPACLSRPNHRPENHILRRAHSHAYRLSPAPTAFRPHRAARLPPGP